MSKFLSFEFWNTVARMILRNRILILILIAACTVFLGFQWKNMRFSYTEANLLPDDDEINLQYQEFLNKFGEEGNLIVMGVNDPSLFTPKKFAAWNQLAKKLNSYEEVEFTVSIGDLKKLQKNADKGQFEMVPFIEESTPDSLQVKQYRKELFDRLPFYEGLVYSKRSNTVQTAIYLHEDIVNTRERKDFVVKELIPLVERFE